MPTFTQVLLETSARISTTKSRIHYLNLKWKWVQLLFFTVTVAGDTWIYGISSDPTRLRLFREILRIRAKALDNGDVNATDSRFKEFSRLLLKIPERTHHQQLH